MTCPPPTPNRCQPVCPPPEPAPPCRVKPIMRGLHLAQTKMILCKAIAASILGGSMVYFFIGVPRKAAYKDFYAKAECEDWADEMARKGLFQSVPKGSLPDSQNFKK